MAFEPPYEVVELANGVGTQVSGKGKVHKISKVVWPGSCKFASQLLQQAKSIILNSRQRRGGFDTNLHQTFAISVSIFRGHCLRNCCDTWALLFCTAIAMHGTGMKQLWRISMSYDIDTTSWRKKWCLRFHGSERAVQSQEKSVRVHTFLDKIYFTSTFVKEVHKPRVLLGIFTDTWHQLMSWRSTKKCWAYWTLSNEFESSSEHNTSRKLTCSQLWQVFCGIYGSKSGGKACPGWIFYDCLQVKPLCKNEEIISIWKFTTGFLCQSLILLVMMLKIVLWWNAIKNYSWVEYN